VTKRTHSQNARISEAPCGSRVRPVFGCGRAPFEQKRPAFAAGIAVAASTVSGPVVSCSQYNQQTARLRQESQTELLPAVTFSCTVYNQLANSSSPIQAGTLYDWEVLFPLNAPITNSSAILSGATEPQLTVEVVRHGSTTAEGTAAMMIQPSRISPWKR